MGRRTRRFLVNHPEIAEELRAHPYQWGDVNTYPSAYVAAQTAHRIRSASSFFGVYGPAGSFETRVTPVEDGTLLEARYVLGIARALPGLIQGPPNNEPAPGQTEYAAQFWPDAISPLSPATPADAPAPNGAS